MLIYSLALRLNCMDNSRQFTFCISYKLCKPNQNETCNNQNYRFGTQWNRNLKWNLLFLHHKGVSVGAEATKNRKVGNFVIYLLAIQNWNFWTLKWWRENISKIWRLRWRSGTATKKLRSSGASGRASTTSQWLGRRVVFCSLSWGSIPNDRSPGQAGSTSSLSTCWAKYT